MNRDLPPQPVVRKLSASLTKGFAALAAIACFAAGVGPASADDLEEKKKDLQKKIAAQSEIVDDAHVARDNAVSQAADARKKLSDAEASLAKAESDLKEAEALDKKRAEELAKAEETLKIAKTRVEMAKAALKAADERVNEEILVTTQSSAGLSNLAMIFTNVDSSNLNQRAQLATTLFESSAKQLDELEARRLALEEAESEAREAEKKASAAREAAAKQVERTAQIKEQAGKLRSDVADLVVKKDAAEEAAKKTVAAEEKKQSELEAESSAVDRRIRQRIAAEKAAAEKAAREEAARKAANSKSKSSSSSSSSKSSSPKSSSPNRASTGSGKSVPFRLPAGSRLTSKYGMRMHPILGYWKMHDGTDFGASCGTPLLAPADGVVAEKYFSRGYGNRLMIDHGKVNGIYVTTGFNHATKYIVGAGQRVTRGQVVGYVGTTGQSTGCHLHLMVWENGAKANPMGRWFRL